MRTRLVLLAASLLLVGAACGGGSTPSKAAATSDTSSPAPPSITAQGVGRVTGVPDLLTVAFNVHAEGDTANATLQADSAAAQQVLDAAKAQGIDEKDIATNNVSLQPRYDYSNNSAPRLMGYSADNSFSVKLRDPSTMGTTIDALSQVGGDAVQIQGISYSFDDDTALLAAARKDAVERAAAQAKQLADAAGVHLGGVRTITEASSGGPDPLRYAAAGAGGTGAASVPVQPGTQQLTLTVTVVYDIG
jgi:uncharacterized protein YggE